MRFVDVIGNASVAKALVSMADSGRVAHAMLMYENEGCGAMALALAYVQYLNCANPSGGDSCGECPSCRQMAKLIHPDVHFVFPVNKGPKASEEKPTSESYLKYWRELVLSDPYFSEADLQRAIGIESKVGLIAVAEAKSIISRLSLASVTDGYKAVIFYLPESGDCQPPVEDGGRTASEDLVHVYYPCTGEGVADHIFPLSEHKGAAVDKRGGCACAGRKTGGG